MGLFGRAEGRLPISAILCRKSDCRAQILPEERWKSLREPSLSKRCDFEATNDVHPSTAVPLRIIKP